MLSFATNTLSFATPLIFAALAGYLSERSGVINIALEGKMLLAACLAAIVGAALGPVAGIAAGLAAAVGLSMLHAIATQTYRVDHVVSGMAVNAIAAGAANFVLLRNRDTALAKAVELPPLGVFQVLALVSVVVIALWVAKTRAGLRLVAVGNDPFKARLAGLQPVHIRFAALVGTGLLAGLGGIYLVANSAGNYTDNMTAGRGYIALAALILGGWRPVASLVVCFVFAAFAALSVQFQGQPFLGLAVPGEFWTALPYVVTLIALALAMGRTRAPGGLGRF